MAAKWRYLPLRRPRRISDRPTRLARGALSTNIGSYFRRLGRTARRARSLGARPRVARSASSRSNEVTNARRWGQSPFAKARKPRLCCRHISRQSSSNVKLLADVGESFAASFSTRRRISDIVIRFPFRSAQWENSAQTSPIPRPPGRRGCHPASRLPSVIRLQ
jgi:hypothetical protein